MTLPLCTYVTAPPPPARPHPAAVPSQGWAAEGSGGAGATLITEVKKAAEQTMDDFFDDVDLSEPEEDKSEVLTPAATTSFRRSCG